MKRLPALLVLISILAALTSCGNGGDREAATVSEPYSTEAPATDSSGDSASSISLADVCTLISATITDPAADHRVISSDDHSLSFGFWIDGMASMIETYQSPLSDGTDFKTSFPEDWNAIISSWSVDMYNSIKALVSRSDVPDARIIICMLDDRDQGSILLGIADGEVITDIVNGIGQ